MEQTLIKRAIFQSKAMAEDAKDKMKKLKEEKARRHLYAHVFLKLPVRPLVRPSARPPVRPPVRPSARPPVRPSARPPVRPPVRPSARKIN